LPKGGNGQATDLCNESFLISSQQCSNRVPMGRLENVAPDATKLITPADAVQKTITAETEVKSWAKPTEVQIGEEERVHDATVQDVEHNILLNGQVKVNHPVYTTVRAPTKEFKKKIYIRDNNGNDLLAPQAKVAHGTD